MPTKSCESDAIPTQVLKGVLPLIITPLTTLINLALEEGIFAETWKVAIICPLIKKLGLELVHSNYRSVSNLPFLSKVVEKCLLKQFNIHCDNNNLLPDYQSADRQNYSTETAIIKLCNDILWAMENQQLTAFSIIDLSAAFDTVDHDILLNVLTTKFNVIGPALKLLDGYLRPRYCKVAVNGHFSSNKELALSVPQGSCAGPVLYTAYSSTMSEVVPKQISIHGYVDDHGLKKSYRPIQHG